MFESDDFDQVLSQLDLPEVCSKIPSKNITKNGNVCGVNKSPNKSCKDINIKSITYENTVEKIIDKKIVESSYEKSDNLLSPKQCKRRIINSHFDSECKRKFPGPAGLLTGHFEECKDEEIGHIQLLSQDIDIMGNSIQKGLFKSGLWKRLQDDVNKLNLKSVETIKTVKEFAVNGSLKCRKAQTITAFVESVDRSAIDPLVTLRDLTGNIKCTLHRDAWSHFSSYIVPEYSALVLWRPTVLTTGGAFKKHYLNITLSNILAIYSSVIVQDEEKSLANGYEKVIQNDCIIIKMEKESSEKLHASESHIINSSDFLEDLDNVFSDEIF